MEKENIIQDAVDENGELEEIKEKKTFKQLIKTYVPIPSLVLFFITVLAGGIHLTCLISESFADFYNRNIGAFVRMVLAYLTGWIPFSLAETVIIAIPILLFVLIYLSIKAFKKSDDAATRYVVALFSVLFFLYSIFVLGYGMGYHGTPLSEKLGLKEQAVSAEQLDKTARILLDEIEPLLDKLSYSSGGASVMPYSLDTMNDKLNDTYKKVCKKYKFIQDLRSNIKYIVLSEPMTYTHISGVYSYYTGEANLNINFPDYTLPYTAAHELAHQRGIAPENEANFVAFLVTKESDDPYIKYSAYINMLEYIINALYVADPQMYYDLYSEFDPRIRYELFSFSEFFEEYRESVASEVSDVVNDTYLKTQGQSAGTASYGMVVDLTVAYYMAQDK